MAIRFRCENSKCGKPLRVKDEVAGKRIKCPSCGHSQRVPAVEESEESEAAAGEINSLEQAMSAAAESAVEQAAAFGYALDYSETSIRSVEVILEGLHDSIGRDSPPENEIERMATMFGAYIGEVIKRKWGGRWKLESKMYGDQKVLTFETGDHELWPHFKVGKRLTNGPEDNVWHYFQILRKEL
jgi:hypothetical protein